MNTIPTAPLIRIDKGEYCGTDISGTTATLADVDDPEYGYYLLDGPRAGYAINEDYISEAITIWRPCASVPIGELELLRSAFMGVELNRLQFSVIQKLIAHLPKNTPDTL